jgi:hypothetical protein
VKTTNMMDTILSGSFGDWNRDDIVICSLHCKCRILEKLIRLLAIKNPHNCDKVLHFQLLFRMVSYIIYIYFSFPCKIKIHF